MFSDPASNLAKLGVLDGMKVADIGAGSGFYTMEAARKVGSTGRVYAVDVQKDLLERLRSQSVSEGLGNVEVLWGNAEKIGGTKIRESLIDRAILSNTLFQIEKPDECALELKRIIRSKGKLLVVDWSESSPLSPQNIFPAMKAQALFEKSGFTLESSFSAGDHHYGLVFIRN